MNLFVAALVLAQAGNPVRCHSCQARLEWSGGEGECRFEQWVCSSSMVSIAAPVETGSVRGDSRDLPHNGLHATTLESCLGRDEASAAEAQQPYQVA